MRVVIPRAGNWKLLFRQTAPKYMSKRSWLSVNAGQPRNPNYSILGKLDNADRGADGDFTFKIIWPRHAGQSSLLLRNTKGYSSTYLAMGFANVRAGTHKRRGVFGYPPEH